jgi:predicted peptidase
VVERFFLLTGISPPVYFFAINCSFNMKIFKSFYVFFLIAIWSCHNDDPTEETKIVQSPDQRGWNEGFPAIAVGATSVDFSFETTAASIIYYHISEEPLKLSAEDLVKVVSSPSNSPNKFSGSRELNPNEISVATIKELKEGKKYYSYILAKNKINDASPNTIREIPFTTAIRQDTRQFHSNSENREVNYLIYRPEEIIKNPNKKYPIIFFLGGFGEMATEHKKINLIQNGLLPEYIQKGNDVPMIVMSVQHIHQEWQNPLINEAMDFAFKNYQIDKNKVYLVGTSGGAFGVWNFAESFAGRLTAIVPISGGGDFTRACTLKALAVWAFHNDQDDLVPPGKSIQMVEAVNECSPIIPAKLLIFPDKGHNCWRRVFDKNHPDWQKSPGVERVDIFQWLLSQSRTTSN